MERGKPDMTVYTFEAAEGRTMDYPDAELYTLDYQEARAYAQEKGYRLIENEYEWQESGLLEDYTPEVRCQYCDDVIEVKQGETFWSGDGALNPSDERRYCGDAPDGLHKPEDVSR